MKASSDSRTASAGSEARSRIGDIPYRLPSGLATDGRWAWRRIFSRICPAPVLPQQGSYSTSILPERTDTWQMNWDSEKVTVLDAPRRTPHQEAVCSASPDIQGHAMAHHNSPPRRLNRLYHT